MATPITNPLLQILNLQKARLRRLYRDWRVFKPRDFARKIRIGKSGCQHLLCQYQSPIPAQLRSKARLKNLQMYCELLSNVLIKPQQVFSISRLLKQPSALRGYKAGPHFDGCSVVSSFEMGLGQIASILNYLA